MAKGGGAWKVAYADFVTAMMAFFLVMWICGQDQEMKQSISRYFNNPMGLKPINESPHPDETGNIFSSSSNGELPKSKSMALGMGRRSYSTDREESQSTRLIGDTLFSNQATLDHWKERGAQEMARATREAGGRQDEALKAAISQLAKKMKQSHLFEIPAEVPSVYRDLLYVTFNEVNWNQLAEDVLVEQ
jgi:chemotaxis protein MotB